MPQQTTNKEKYKIKKPQKKSTTSQVKISLKNKTKKRIKLRNESLLYKLYTSKR